MPKLKVYRVTFEIAKDWDLRGLVFANSEDEAHNSAVQTCARIVEPTTPYWVEMIA